MKNDWTFLFLGIVSAVAAALFVEWLNRTFHSPTSTANDLAWQQQLTGSYCRLPNLNLAPESPASAYQGGAPVTNYRRYTRIGVLEIQPCGAA